MSNYKQISNTIWNVADLLRGSWKAHEYQDVILPLTVLKRLDVALEPTKEKVITRFNELDGKVSDLRILMRLTGYDFYNTSPYTIKKLLDDPSHIEKNTRNYLEGFSDNVKDIFKKFKFNIQLDRLKGGDLLYLILSEFNKIDLHPDSVSNHEIGLAFEDLIRRFAEQSNETAGEHYTPRDVVRLMTALMFTDEEETLKKRGASRTLYDPACGTGGMLTVGKEYILENFNKNANIFLFGQELNGQTYAICKADMLLKGEDPERIKGGDAEHNKASTLSNDEYAEEKFDYIISNPPYGVEWKKDKKAVDKEYERGFSGRFGAGLPRISDGQFLFIEHAISKFKPITDGGSDAVIITNGSPLFTGDAGGGESNIRRWLIENDYIDTIIALPESLFFNTGIPTYIWMFTNRKTKNKKNKIQLIDARKSKTQLRKNLGNKRYEISREDADEIVRLYMGAIKNGRSKVLDSSEFGYRAVTIQRPLRLKFNMTEEKIKEVVLHLGVDISRAVERVKIAKKNQKESTGTVLGHSSEKMSYKADEQLEIQLNITTAIKSLRGKIWNDRKVFIDDVETALALENGVLPAKKVVKTIVDIVGEHDDSAEICKDKDGNPEPDKELKDVERVPLKEDIYKYFKREVKPYVPDAWIDEDVRDEKDGEVGKVGYEIPFTRYFYKYEPPRAVEEIEREIKELEKEILEILKEL